MDGLIELYRLSPDWLKLALILQPTLWLWGIVAMVLYVRHSGPTKSASRRGQRVYPIRPVRNLSVANRSGLLPPVPIEERVSSFGDPER